MIKANASEDNKKYLMRKMIGYFIILFPTWSMYDIVDDGTGFYNPEANRAYKQFVKQLIEMELDV